MQFVFLLDPRRIEIVSSTDGSSQRPAESAARGRRPSHVLPVFRRASSRRRNATRSAQGRLQHVGGVHRPSALPAPTSVCNSSIKQDDLAGSGGDLGQDASAAPRTRRGTWHRRPARRGRARGAAYSSALGYVAVDDAQCQPLDIAVLPTPGSPISTGLFLVRRDSTWIVRRISSSRPITGSSLPSRATSVSRAHISSALVAVLGRGRLRRATLANLLDRGIEVLRRHATRG